MNLLPEIPYERYNDTQFHYDFLNSNKIIGNEDTDYNGLFHIHWRGPIDNDKVILQIKSILATQQVSKICFWVEDMTRTFMSPGHPKLMQFKDLIEVKVFDKSIFDLASGNDKNKSKIWQYYNYPYCDRRYKTDVFRWVILNIYGGVYTDADTFLLRDLRDIHLKNWCSKWGVEPYLEACILKLEKGNDLYEQMYLNNPNSQQCYNFYVLDSNAGSYEHKNYNITSLPNAFFDIVWNEENHDLPCLRLYDDFIFNHFKYFFLETDKEITLNNFFKGCFAYHWHNNWNDPELKNSVAGRLNQDVDKIIQEKYNIKPYKIFQK